MDVESKNTSLNEPNPDVNNQNLNSDNNKNVEGESFVSQIVEDYLEKLKKDDNYKKEDLTPIEIEKLDEFVKTGQFDYSSNTTDVNINVDETNIVSSQSYESVKSNASFYAAAGTSTSATVARSNLFQKIDLILTDDSFNFEKLLLKSLPQDVVKSVQKHLKEME